MFPFSPQQKGQTMTFGKISIKGIEYEVAIDGKSGTFSTKIGTEMVMAKSLEALRAKLAKEVKSVLIPALTINDDYWNRGRSDNFKIKEYEIVGIHGGNGNILAQEKGSQSRQQVRHHTFYKSDMDRKKAKALFEAQEKAKAEYDKFLEDHQLTKDIILAEIERQQTEEAPPVPKPPRKKGVAP
jgi:hypothetical protein